jgi:hypothetical protein
MSLIGTSEKKNLDLKQLLPLFQTVFQAYVFIRMLRKYNYILLIPTSLSVLWLQAHVQVY